ncbi:MAG TPA: mandelate racemase/muconate lactonizing enzyme family protein [Bauldia sp.]|nr:mandelate racemase/muconate lactonizing enzyme family protein [Bauldia sp.]
MKITNIKATPVVIDFTEPEYWSQGKRLGVTAIIIEIETDKGITGIGESIPTPNVEVTVAAIQSMGAVLLGRDPRELSRLWLDVQAAGWMEWQFMGNACFAAIEMALWDILGKAAGLPVHALLGGAIRDKMEVMGFVQNSTPEKIKADAARMVRDGFKTVYTKVGFGMERDIASVKALRAGAGEGVELRVDPNESWSSGHTIRMAHALQPYGLQYIEQPIRLDAIKEMAVLRQRSPVPIAANQASWLNWQVLDIIREGAADVIMTDPWQAGGILNFFKAAAMCEIAGLPIVYHSVGPLSIGTSAAMQVICSSKAFIYANQTYLHMNSGDVVKQRLKIERAHIALPKEPGLGLEIDQDALAGYHEEYKRRGTVGAHENLEVVYGAIRALPSQ